MKAWRRLVYAAVSLLTIVSMVVTSLPRPALAVARQIPAPPAVTTDLLVPWPENAVAGIIPPPPAPTHTVYLDFLPLVARNYVPPTTTWVDPETGGALAVPPVGLELTLQPGAVTQSVALTCALQPPPDDLPPVQHLVGTAFELTARTASGQPVTHLLPQVVTRTVPGPGGTPQTEYIVTNTVVVTISYSDAAVAGLDERHLRLHTRSAGGDWTPLLTVVDPANNVASAPLSRLSDFALLGVTAVPTATWVVLDPDHGGADPGGTVLYPRDYAIEEKAVNLNTALAVRDWLQGCGVNVLMTREDDSSVSPQWRADFINSAAPDGATTVAFNIVTHNMDYFVGGPLGLADFGKPGDKDFAQLLVEEISNTTALPPDRGVYDARTWRGGIYLPTHVTDTLYAQIESAFLDSYNDRDKVIDRRLEYVAGGIYNGIIFQLELTACVPFSSTVKDERLYRTLGINSWTRYTAQGVNPVTGNQFQWSRDLFVPGVGLNVDIVRYYNSQAGDAGIFGNGWSTLYDMKVTPLDDGALEVRYADGHRGRFTPDGSGGYQAEPGIWETLTIDGGGYLLTTPDQLRFSFDGAGVLQSIADETGNAITLQYSGGNLDAIVDTSGRTFDVSTDGAGHVTRIVDPAGRAVTYTYGLRSLEYTRYLEGLRGGPIEPHQASDLLRMTDARGGTTKYEYDPAGGYLQRISDPESIGYLENLYTPDGRVQEQRNGRDDPANWDYDLANMRATYTDAEGNTTTYVFDGKYRVVEEIDALGQSIHYEYDDHDNITAMTDKRGNTWRYTYDERGNMLTRQDPLDQWSMYDSDVTTWTYDDKNNVTSMTDALGNTWTYQYDGQSHPIIVTEPNGAVTTAEYDDKGQMVRLVDAEGRETRFDYDDHGNKIKTWDAEGGWTASTYDGSGRETSRTECLNPPACTETRTTYFEYDENGNKTKEIDPLGQVTRFEYDGNNMLKKKIDRRGGEWEYWYDGNLNLIKEEDPLNRATEYTYNKENRRLTVKDALGRITRFDYDDLYRLITVTNPADGVYRYEYDPNGNLLALEDPLHYRTSFVYDAANRRKFVHDAIGGTTEYCYDPLDRIVQAFDPRRAEVQLVYDHVGNMTEIVDPLGNRTTMGYDRVHNRTRLTVGIPSDGGEPDGSTTYFEYDGLNREIRRTDALSRTVYSVYDGVGNTVVITDAKGYATHFTYNLNGWLTLQTDPLGGQTRYAYDAEGATTAITDANGHADTYMYDLTGQLRRATDPLGAATWFGYDAVGNQTRVTDSLDYTTIYTYSVLNLLTAERDPLGHITHYDYDPLRRLVGRTDANGITLTYDYNPLGWLTGVHDAAGGFTRYGYDLVGNRTVITDANGIATRFEYNFLDQLKREINPLGKTWEYSYDARGNMVRRVDGKWQATYYYYDKADQLIATVYGINAGGNYSATFEYDANGNEIAMHDWNGDWAYTYDELNRRTSATDYNGRTLSWEYDAVGNRTAMVYPDGRRVEMTYNAGDRLDQLTDAQGRVVEWDYNPLGYITAQANPNGTRADYLYDAAGRLRDLRNLGPGGVVISAYDYAMDAVGNRTRVVEQRGPAVVTRDYEYDDLYQLTRARTDTGQDMAYLYDPVGNRRQKVGTPEPVGGEPPTPENLHYTYNDLNAMLTSGPTSFAYDDNGNRVRKSEPLTATDYISLALSLGWDVTGTVATAYAYDYENRMTAVTTTISYTYGLSHTPGMSRTMAARYIYDGMGRRVEKWVTTTITASAVLGSPQILHRDYVFDGLDPVMEYDDLTGTVTSTVIRQYVYGNERMVLLERTENDQTHSYWYHYDGLGSVVALTDEAGVELCREQYDEYGNRVKGCPELNHYTYTGQEHDVESGLVHFFARYYAPTEGIWLSQDTYRGSAETPLTLNRYLYGLNNPICYIDQYGQIAWFAVIAVVVVSVYIFQSFTSPAYAPASEEQAQELQKEYEEELQENDLLNTLTGYKDARRAMYTMRNPNASDSEKALAAAEYAYNLVDFTASVMSGLKLLETGLAKIGGRGAAKEAVGAVTGLAKKQVEEIGEDAMLREAKKKGYKSLLSKAEGVAKRYHGFDAIFENGKRIIIGEAKGGTSRLVGKQMSKEWVARNARKLLDGTIDERKLGQKILDAMNGKGGKEVIGEVFTTKIKDGKVMDTVVKTIKYLGK